MTICEYELLIGWFASLNRLKTDIVVALEPLTCPHPCLGLLRGGRESPTRCGEKLPEDRIESLPRTVGLSEPVEVMPLPEPFGSQVGEWTAYPVLEALGIGGAGEAGLHGMQVAEGRALDGGRLAVRCQVTAVLGG